ncbi:MAG TPA: archaellar assembly protein FlaJ [Methanothermococcus okinawensis]|uniref:Archaellar assembly protein FlaJ n=1 Tax=Methanothermococcus okinawensis TaxID=155863 RepID=A0A833DQG6_9EURY|nr:archaellar assembly protein FlaJ [Methanothermococcus okinawensis]
MFLDALSRLGLSPRDYLLKYVLPAFVISIILSALGLTYFSGYVKLLVLLISILVLISAIGYPYIELDTQKNKINEKLHIFITKFGVLSITDLDRKDLMRILASEKEELGQLAEESKKLYVLIKRWNQSLAEACRFMAKRTPSSEFSDFLDRMAYSIDSGEDLKDFLLKEQSIVMNDYAAFYKRAIYSLDMFKEIYISAITSLAFFVTFAVIAPFIVPYNFVTAVTLAILGFIVLEVCLVYMVKAKMPSDKLWHTSEMVTPVDAKLKKYLIISILLTVVSLGVILWGRYIAEIPKLTAIPYQILFTLGFTPLFIGGYVAKREEDIVIRKEQNFPDFLRSLGDSVDAKGGGMTDSLKYLSSNDFGPLTSDLKNLYKRVVIRINNNKAWRLFGVETCSYLIQLFSEMFERCIFLGGSPGQASDIISTNFRKIINLRKSKYQSVEQFTAIIYGLGGGLALALFTSYGVAYMITNLYNSLQIPEAMISIINITTLGNLSLISYMMYTCLVIYSLISAYLIKIMDGGHPQVLLYHFVIILWIASLVSVATELIINKVLGVGIPIY